MGFIHLFRKAVFLTAGNAFVKHLDPDYVPEEAQEDAEAEEAKAE